MAGLNVAATRLLGDLWNLAAITTAEKLLSPLSPVVRSVERVGSNYRQS